MRLKKLIVAAEISDARTRAEPAMNRAPAVTEPWPSSAGGSAGRIRAGCVPPAASSPAASSTSLVLMVTSTPPAEE